MATQFYTLNSGGDWVAPGRDIAATSYPYPTYTDFPVVNYADLYQSGDTFDMVMNTRVPASSKCQGGFYLALPNGFDEEIAGFSQASNTYGVYTPLCYGIWGNGPGQARISIRENSMTSAQQARVPLQSSGGINPLYVMRLGPNNGSNFAVIHNYGFTLAGHDQATNPNTSLPYNYNGYSAYYQGSGSTLTWVRFQGVGAADWNSPPGECPQVNVEKCTDILIEGCEFSGINLDGTQTSGSIECNGATNVTYTDCYAHDSNVSGVTFSTEGSAQAGQRTDGITTNNLKAWHNANHRGLSNGQTFSGINHEGVMGTITHNNPDIIIDNNTTVAQAHVSVGNAQGDSTIIINEPNYHPELSSSQPTWAAGCFAVKCPTSYAGGTNQQQISSITVVLNGVTLTPVIWPGHTPSANPATNFVVLTS